MVDIRRHVFIKGKVQGVGFRSSVRYKANELNIKGWVKNLYDGRVEAVFTGHEVDIKKMLQYVKKGPRFASVDNVKVKNEKYVNEYEDFYIKY